ncbi:MAG: type I phosphomannose isomerase catalytic subunit [Planctomycetota bacterium]
MSAFGHRSDELPRRGRWPLGRLRRPTTLLPRRTISTPLEPFLLERELLPKVWGGRALADTLGIELPADGASIGESWELFDRPAGSSGIRGRGESLAALTRRCPDELVGRGVRLGHDGAFPLMLKFLDAREALSLQVHPDDEQARGDLGKDECCLVLAVTEDARFVHGLRPGVDKEQLLASLESAAVESMLYTFKPEVGQLVHVPPGTPHAMGPGVVAFEIQENSDLTYRCYDWGRSREVQPDQARDVVQMVHHERPPVERSTSLADGGELLLVTEHFFVRRYQVDHRIELPTDGGYLTLTCLAGSGRLEWGGGDLAASLALGRPDTALVPACVPSVAVEPDGLVDVVVCGPGAR